MRNAIIAILALCAVAVFAADVKVKYSGPSGQGDIIYVGRSTGTTNLTFSANGLKDVTFSDPLQPGSTALAAGKILVGNDGGSAAAQTMSGEATIDTNGVVTVSESLAAGKLFVGNDGGSAAAVSMSGGATIDTNGVVTLSTTGYTTNLTLISNSGATTQTWTIANGLITDISP